MYALRVLPSAEKALRVLPRSAQRRIARTIDALGEDPRPRGAVKLAGVDSLWRVRVRDYRIIYSIEDRALVVLVIRVGHRRDVYRR
jgi:mRNA interferase RelE/StbE